MKHVLTLEAITGIESFKVAHRLQNLWPLQQVVQLCFGLGCKWLPINSPATYTHQCEDCYLKQYVWFMLPWFKTFHLAVFSHTHLLFKHLFSLVKWGDRKRSFFKNLPRLVWTIPVISCRLKISKVIVRPFKTNTYCLVDIQLEATAYLSLSCGGSVILCSSYSCRFFYNGDMWGYSHCTSKPCCDFVSSRGCTWLFLHLFFMDANKNVPSTFPRPLCVTEWNVVFQCVSL